MKVLIFSYFYKGANFSGGPTYSVPALAERLVRLGIEVDVATSDIARDALDGDIIEYVDNKVRVHVFKTTDRLPDWIPVKSLMFKRFPALGDWLDKSVGKYDVVIVRNTYFPHLKKIVNFFSGTTTIYYAAGELNFNRVKSGLLKKLPYLLFYEIPSINKFKKIISLTDGELSDYKFWRLTPPIEVVPNGIEDFTPESCDIESCRKGGVLNFCFFGRIHDTKGIFELLSAFHALSDRPVKLSIAGSIEKGEQERFHSELNRLADVVDVSYVGCITSSEEKYQFLREQDIFVLPTAAEGMSIALLEAMIAGNLIVTTPGSNMQHYIDGVCGFICDKNIDDLTALLKRVETMTSDEILLMKQKSRDIARKNFLWDTVVNRFLDVVKTSDK